MLIKNDKIYRNLQEQVLENQKTIQYILEEQGVLNQFGIKVVGTIPPEQDPPTPEEYKENTGVDLEFGDAIARGTEGEYYIYIWTRGVYDRIDPFWLNVGQFPAPSTVPGPEGPEGPQGPVGVRGSRWFVDPDKPYSGVDSKQWDCSLDASTGDVYQLKKNDYDWDLIGNIRGPVGPVGPQGPQGPQGIQGLQGIQGAQGPAGQFIEVKGELSSTTSLPDPNTTARSAAYLIPDASGANHIWLIGEDADGLVWIDAGSFGGGAKITASDNNVVDADMTYVNTEAHQYIRTIVVENENGNIKLGLRSEFDNLGGTNVFKLYDFTLTPLTDGTVVFEASGDNKLKVTLSDATKAQLANAVQKSTSPSVVYGTDLSGNQTLYKAVTTPTGNAVVLRQSNGCIQVPSAPQAATDAVSKKYVDDTEDVLTAQIDGITPTIYDFGTGTSGTITNEQLAEMKEKKFLAIIKRGNMYYQYSGELDQSGPGKTVTWTHVEYSTNRGDERFYGIYIMDRAGQDSASWSATSNACAVYAPNFYFDAEKAENTNPTYVATYSGNSMTSGFSRTSITTLKSKLGIPTYYLHNIKMWASGSGAAGNQLYFSFISTQSTAYTLDTILAAVKKLTGDYYKGCPYPATGIFTGGRLITGIAWGTISGVGEGFYIYSMPNFNTAPTSSAAPVSNYATLDDAVYPIS